MLKKEVRKLFYHTLAALYDDRETQAIFRLYIEERLKMPVHLFFMDMGQELNTSINITADLQRLAAGEPIQHLIGQTEFYGRIFKTDKRALVPRRETEELTYRILHELRFPNTPSIMDLCTGSGIIAITLAKEIADAQVDAIDVSQDALDLAAENAETLHADVHFQCADIFKLEQLSQTYDLIVSNPPYIPENERQLLHKNVVDYEPAEALFVPNETPIQFYEKIAVLAQKSLRTNGYLYFETHEKFHAEIAEMLTQKGFYETMCFNDMQNKPRFIRTKKKL